jgi:hypothetical protein
MLDRFSPGEIGGRSRSVRRVSQKSGWRASAVVAESHRVPGRQQLIGIVAHQCHETSDIAGQPGSDDRMGAYPEIVCKFGRHNLGQIKTSVSDGSAPSVAADGPGSLCKHIRRHMRRWCRGRGRHGGLPSRSRRNDG